MLLEMVVVPVVVKLVGLVVVKWWICLC